ncbi:J domain-containing protein [Deinococcus aestuarii]|uniref:J domain-containing protein n=1 Tax=Deinococcus aestuarii TaxID=2774531 RepID=UPI001C0DD392|nr:J domain-containing protein [Deinococcus aestuarii]
MSTERPPVLFRLLHLLGLLGARKEAVTFSPDVRGARMLAAATVAFTVLLFAQLALGLRGAVPLALALVVFALSLRSLDQVGRLLALALLVILFLLARLLSENTAVLLVAPVLAFLALRHLAVHRRALGFDRALGRLAGSLGEGWKVYLPRDPQASHVARVLVSPEGQTFFLGVTPGRAEQRYGTPHVNWRDVTADTVRSLAARDPGVVSRGQHVLWVVKPPQAQGDYETTAEHGVSTVIGTADDLAGQLQTWSGMRRNLEQSAPKPSPAEFGRQVEAEAVQELYNLMPPEWEMIPNLLLTSGGDADAILMSPAGEKYVVDVKARTDRMDLQAPKGDRVKSWQEIHDQVRHAARQLQGVPVVWQPRARDTDFSLMGEVWCLRGGAADLLEALETLGGTGGGGEPHEVLGVGPDASPEEIRAAYRDLAKKYHPDRVGHLGPEFRQLAERRMQAINAAYRKLLG